MSKLTDEQKADLQDLHDRLRAMFNEAQTLTMSFADDDPRGDDFYENVEVNIEVARQEIWDILHSPQEETND